MSAIEIAERITESGNWKLIFQKVSNPGIVKVSIELVDPEQARFWSEKWQEAERAVDEETGNGPV